MSTCAVCGAELDREWVLRHARKCRPFTPCWRARNREAARKHREANPEYERAAARAYRAEVRAHTRAGRHIAASAIERTAAVHIGAAAIGAWQAAQRADADRALVRKRSVTSQTRGHAQARLAHSDECMVQTARARDDLIRRALADVRALRQAAWNALGDRDRSEL